jgi:type IV secretion system protein VirD4
MDRLLLVGLLAAAGVVLVLLATGHVSALVFEGGWPRYRLSDAPGVVWRAVQRPGDPGRAWDPVNVGAAPPGPVAWWSTLVVEVTLAATAVAAVLNAGRRRRRPASGEWAGARQLRPLRTGHRDSGRLVVGTAHHRRVAVEARHSLLVFGATQSGKTTGAAIPAILEWNGPVVATTVKDDLIRDTIGWRAEKGKVAVFDPTGASAYRDSGWSPLAGVTAGPTANRAAWELAMAAKASVGTGMSLANFWFSGAAKCLAPYLLAAASSGRGMGDVARWVDAEDRDEVLDELQAAGHRDAWLAHQATFRREDRSRSSLFQCMQQIVAGYLDPTVAASADRADIDVRRLLDGGAHTLYVSAPPRDQERLRPLFATLVGQVIAAVYDHAAMSKKPLDPPLLVVLDEAANIAPVEDLPTIASTAASMGLQLVTVFQDLAQIKGRYGDASATIVNNHRAKLLLPGVSDVDTLELVSRLAGDEEIDRDSVTTDAGGRRSSTTAGQFRRLLPLEAARQLPRNYGVLVYGSLRPIRVRLRPWFAHRELRRRATVSGDAHLAEALHREPPGLAASPGVATPRRTVTASPSPPPVRRREASAPTVAPRPPGGAGDAPVVSIFDAARPRHRGPSSPGGKNR